MRPCPCGETGLFIPGLGFRQNNECGPLLPAAFWPARLPFDQGMTQQAGTLAEVDLAHSAVGNKPCVLEAIVRHTIILS